MGSKGLRALIAAVLYVCAILLLLAGDPTPAELRQLSRDAQRSRRSRRRELEEQIAELEAEEQPVGV